MEINKELTFDDLDEWEEWNPQKESFMLHTISGSIAGVSEHMLVFPLDTMKTFLQTEGSNSSKLRNAFINEGPMRLMRGASTMFAGCIPAHAAYFSIYEWGKINFGADGPSHAPIAAAASGMSAVVAHDLIMTPLDVVKQRLQLGFHNGLFDAFKSIIRTEGLSALFISFPTTLLMNLPFAAVSVAANETFKKILNPKNEYNLPVYFLCGGLAGAVAGACTTPLDVIKTRLQTQHILRSTSSSIPIEQISSFSTNITKKSYLQVGSSLFPSINQSNIIIPNFASAAGSSRNKYKIASTKCNGMRPVGDIGSMLTGTTTWCEYQGKYCSNESCAAELNKRHEKLSNAKSKQIRTSTQKVSSQPMFSSFISFFRKSKIHSEDKYGGLVDTAYRIYKEEGMQAFLRGVRPRVMVQAPAVAISWSSYETAKSILSNLGV